MDLFRKRRALGAFCLLGGFLILIGIFYACTDDFGVEADFFKGNIRGQIVLSEPVPPNTDEIRVAVSKTFPPADILGLIFTGPLPFTKDSTVTSQTIPYDLQLPLGDYQAVFTIWKELDKSFSPADIIGLYGDYLFNEPIPVTITGDVPVAENVDMDINFAKVVKNAKIEGKITYVGDWPENTGNVAIFVFPIVPQDLSDFLSFVAFEVLPKNLEEFEYSVRISAGDYKYVAVFWQAEGAPLTQFTTLGFYPNPNNSNEPGEVFLQKNETLTGIDIVADFANVK